MLDDKPPVKLGAEDACHQIHAALRALPLLGSPAEVPFRDGIYFFYEDGEKSEHAADGRVVRVGNHPRSVGRLVQRLGNHYSGRKNGSVFRKFLGGALLRSRDPGSPCLAPAPGKGHWEHENDKACECCKPLEDEVSQLLRSSFRFRCVEVVDKPERNELESVLIATIAACPVCGPSAAWLGRHAYSEKVRSSGLWNSRDVGGPTITAHQLKRFRSLAQATLEAFGEGRDAMTTASNPEKAGTSRVTLFVTHCSKDKNPAGGKAATMYRSPRIRRFSAACEAAGVPWAILSAEYALFFPDERHECYDTELRFDHGRVRVYKDKQLLSPRECQTHVQSIVKTVRLRLEALGFGRVQYYVGGRLPPAYPLVMHKALDHCSSEHHTVPNLLNCIEAAGRLHLVPKIDNLLVAIARGTVDHLATETLPEDPRPRTVQPSTRLRTATGTPTADDFRVTLKGLLEEAERSGQSYVEVLAGNLHRRVGGYPGKSHNMPGCVAVMKAEMRPGDEVVNAPPSGKGASVIIRYRLPRGSRKEAE